MDTSRLELSANKTFGKIYLTNIFWLFIYQIYSITAMLVIIFAYIINTIMAKSTIQQITEFIPCPTATYCGLVNGLAAGYSSPASPDLQQPGSSLVLDRDQVSLLGSMMPLGALFGSLVCGWSMERLGRRTTMLLISLPAVGGWLFITYAGSFGSILTGRILTGFATGCGTVVVPAYVGEVCEPRIRGAMGASLHFLGTIGVLISYIIGKYAHWNFLAMACTCFASVWPVLVCLIHESPVWLLEHGRDSQALEALTWLRGRHADVGGEMKALRKQVELDGDMKKASVLDLVNPDNLRQFVMAMMVMVMQQLSGISAVTFYTTDIFEDAGSSIEPSLATIICGLVQMMSTFAAVVLVDRLGRKVLLLLSNAISGACMLAIGVYFQMQSDGTADNLGWLPLVSLMLCLFAHSIGLGPIPWLIMSKLLRVKHNNLKSIASIRCSLIVFQRRRTNMRLPWLGVDDFSHTVTR